MLFNKSCQSVLVGLFAFLPDLFFGDAFKLTFRMSWRMLRLVSRRTSSRIRKRSASPNMMRPPLISARLYNPNTTQTCVGSPVRRWWAASLSTVRPKLNSNKPSGARIIHFVRVDILFISLLPGGFGSIEGIIQKSFRCYDPKIINF